MPCGRSWWLVVACGGSCVVLERPIAKSNDSPGDILEKFARNICGYISYRYIVCGTYLIDT